MSARDQGAAFASADYLLSIGPVTHRQLHDTGAAAPFLIFPSVVGYEKTQSLETLPAVLLDLQSPQPPDYLLCQSAYSEVAAGLFYGVMTIAMPEPAVRDALARDVAHTLAAAHPNGAIRLLVLHYDPPAPGPAHDRTGTVAHTAHNP
jgi:hypothetical protein